MARHLTARDFRILTDLIDAWSGKLTWEGLCDRAGEVIGFRPTHQTLNAHGPIKSAFSEKKIQLKAGATPSKRPQSLAIAEQRIFKLESENSRLIAENERLIERFVRWQYNAEKRGLTKAVLDDHLPAIDRDSSE